MEVHRLSDSRVIDIEKDDEIFLRLLHQILHLFFESTNESVVHLQFAAWATSEVGFEVAETRAPGFSVVGEDGLELVGVDYGRGEGEDLFEGLCGEDVRGVL